MVAAAGFEKKNRQTENFPPPFTRHSSLPCLCIIIAFTRFVCSNHTICTRCGIIINSRHEYMYIVYILYYSISRICVFTAEYIHIYCIYLYGYTQKTVDLNTFFEFSEKTKDGVVSLSLIMHPQSHSLPPLQPFCAGDDYPRILSTVCVVKIFLQLTTTHAADYHRDRLFDPCTVHRHRE